MSKPRELREPMTQAEIDAITPHPLWSDGRSGYEWCRFDARLGPDGDPRWLRAEVTWDDDSDFDDNDSALPTRYFDPKLWIETNSVESFQPTVLKTYDGVAQPLTRAEAVELISGDPNEILTRYADLVSRLAVPQTE